MKRARDQVAGCTAYGGWAFLEWLIGTSGEEENDGTTRLGLVGLFREQHAKRGAHRVEKALSVLERRLLGPVVTPLRRSISPTLLFRGAESCESAGLGRSFSLPEVITR